MIRPINASFPFDSIPEISINYRLSWNRCSKDLERYNLSPFYHFLPDWKESVEGKDPKDTSLIQTIFNDRNDTVLNQFCGQFASKIYTFIPIPVIFTYHGINCHNVRTFYEIHKPSILPSSPLSTTFSTFHFPVVTSIKKWSARSQEQPQSIDSL